MSPDTRSSSTSEQVQQLSISSPGPSKAEQAGMLAQQLGSERSWADRFVPELPGNMPTDMNTSPAGPNSTRYHELPQDAAQEDLIDMLTPATSRTASISTSANEASLSRHNTSHDLPPAYDDVMNGPTDLQQTPSATQSSPVINLDRKPVARTSTDPPRSYTLTETYKSISGTFTFYDYLELTSSAGSVSVILDPQPGEVPAVLRVKAQYGSVKITVSDEYLERIEKTRSIPRAWDVEIVARTGSVTTKLPIGRGSTYVIDAHVGSIKSTFYTANAGLNDAVSTLSTITGVGSQKVQIESYQGSLPITNIQAKHYSRGHGALKVAYPKTWQGKMHVSSGGFGSVKVTGDKMEHTRFGDKEQHSWRGDGELVEVRCDGHGSAKVECS